MSDTEPFAFDGASQSHEQIAETSLAKVQDRQRSLDDFADLSAKLDEAMANPDIEVRERESRELRKELNEVTKDLMTDSEDLAQVTVALYDMAQEQGSALSGLEEMHPEAKQIIVDAEEKLAAANAAVLTANQQVGAANAAVTAADNLSGFSAWFGQKTKAKNAAAGLARSANGRLSAAQAQVKAAQQGVEEAPAAAQALHRDRLLNADMEESNQHIRAMHERANEILEENIESATKQLTRREQVLVKTRERLSATTSEAESLRSLFADLEQKLEPLQAKLDSGDVEVGSSKHVALKEQVQKLETELGETKGKADAAEGESNELTEKLETLRMQQDALVVLKTNYERSFRIGTAAAKLNQEISSVRLEIIQGLSDLDIQTELNKVSRDSTVDAARGAADAINAIERARIKYQKDHPEVMRAMHKIGELLADELDYISEEDAAFLEEKRANYGIDGSGSSETNSEAESEEFAL